MFRTTRRVIIALSFTVIIGVAGVAQAGEYRAGDLSVARVWARASAGQAQNGAAYMTVSNAGGKADRLVKAETPAAMKASLHAHVVENGIMMMGPIKAVEVSPGEPVVLKPGGTHIMLMGLKAPLKAGQMFPMTLFFEQSGSVDVQVMVHEPDTMAPGHQGHQMMPH